MYKQISVQKEFLKQTCEGLKAMEVEVVGLKEVNASTAGGRGQLLGDSMH
jgi:hypothetical protein